MTNPFAGLDADTGDGKLYLDDEVKKAVETAFTPYNTALQTLINDALDDTTGYFGTTGNELAKILEETFNGRGKSMTDYLKEQQSQATAFKKTAQDAAAAQEAAEND